MYNTRALFKLKIHVANGSRCEDIFTQIMNYAEPDFQQIKPWGIIGDRKNDGYIKSNGVFFQVFAPEEIQKSYTNVINKLETDFEGLIKQWQPVYEFYIVINDKYHGVNADCEKSLERIRKQHKLKSAGFKTSKDLENKLPKIITTFKRRRIGLKETWPKLKTVSLHWRTSSKVSTRVCKSPRTWEKRRSKRSIPSRRSISPKK